MEKVKTEDSRKIRFKNSLKLRLILYMPIPILLALFGTYQIGYAVNDWQAWYEESVFTGRGSDISEDEVDDEMLLYLGGNYSVYKTEEGVQHYEFHNIKEAGTPEEQIGYWLISFSQVLLTTLWVGVCLFAGGYCYYKRELEKSIQSLLKSADKIADNCLDFEMEKSKPNELGMVCDAFEKMRSSLYETSQENFRLLEERRRLNAAFAHDMRNPVTVLKGYIDLLEHYIPEQRISQEKEMEIIGMVHGQILRLENYIQKMSAVQKLEDITPKYNNICYNYFCSLCEETAKLLDGRVDVRAADRASGADRAAELELQAVQTMEQAPAAVIRIDKELVLEVLENLLANASVYTKDKIILTIVNREEELTLRVEDNGGGFSEEALQMAGSPFYRDDVGRNALKNGQYSDRSSDGCFSNCLDGRDNGCFDNSSDQRDNSHFGLGLYVCRLICEKCGGSLRIENVSEGTGGVVTASFALQSNIP